MVLHCCCCCFNENIIENKVSGSLRNLMVNVKGRLQSGKFEYHLRCLTDDTNLKKSFFINTIRQKKRF